MSIRITIVVRFSLPHKCLSRVFRTPASHSGGFSLVSRPWQRGLSDLLCISITLPRKFVGCILKLSSTASFHILYKSTCTEVKKNAWPNQPKVNSNHNILKKKKHMNICFVKDGFPYSCLLGIKENVQSVHLEFPCRHGRRDTSGTLSSTAPKRSTFPRFHMKLPSRTVWKCESADSNSYMIHAWWCFTTFSSCLSEFLNIVLPG